MNQKKFTIFLISFIALVLLVIIAFVFFRYRADTVEVMKVVTVSEATFDFKDIIPSGTKYILGPPTQTLPPGYGPYGLSGLATLKQIISLPYEAKWLDIGFSGTPTVPPDTGVSLVLISTGTPDYPSGIGGCVLKSYGLPGPMLPCSDDKPSSKQATINIMLYGSSKATPLIPNKIWYKYSYETPGRQLNRTLYFNQTNNFANIWTSTLENNGTYLKVNANTVNNTILYNTIDARYNPTTWKGLNIRGSWLAFPDMFQAEYRCSDVEANLATKPWQQAQKVNADTNFLATFMFSCPGRYLGVKITAQAPTAASYYRINGLDVSNTMFLTPCPKTNKTVPLTFANSDQVEACFGSTEEEIRPQLVYHDFMGISRQQNKFIVPRLLVIEDKIKQKQIDYPIYSLDGFVPKANTNDSRFPSAHAFGLALDINAPTNPNRDRTASMTPHNPEDCIHDIPDSIVTFFKGQYFGWGAEFGTICDSMHFMYGGRWQ